MIISQNLQSRTVQNPTICRPVKIECEILIGGCGMSSLPAEAEKEFRKYTVSYAVDSNFKYPIVYIWAHLTVILDFRLSEAVGRLTHPHT